MSINASIFGLIIYRVHTLVIKIRLKFMINIVMKINSTTFDVGRLLQFIIPSALFRLLVSLMHISTCSFGFPNRSVFIVAVLAFNSLKLID